MVFISSVRFLRLLVTKTRIRLLQQLDTKEMILNVLGFYKNISSRSMRTFIHVFQPAKLTGNNQSVKYFPGNSLSADCDFKMVYIY